jgi:glycosyltransferase involved in cell wall biosynthesis
MISNYEYKYNRIDLGIKSMKYIVEEIPDCKMIIVSNLNNKNLKILVKELELSNHIEFIDNTSNFELYLSNSSLHIFPSMVETFPLILSQTKIHGIPNIITGLDYIPLSKGGTVNINDDEPETIAKEAIKILKDKDYRIKLSKEAKESMNDFKNELINKKWVELLLAIYEGKDSYNEIRMNQKRISEKEIIQILDNQEKLMNIRNNEKRINLDDLLSLNSTS